MFIINSYALAVFFCFITKLCWGSWANTSKVATEKWPFPMFYWDYTFGLIIMALIYGLTMGSQGKMAEVLSPTFSRQIHHRSLRHLSEELYSTCQTCSLLRQ